MQTLEVRNLKFRLDSDVPRYWHGGRRAVTLFYNNLSLFFPPGERFFIRSVRAFRDQLGGELAERTRAFCFQEGFHTREHDRYNKMLRDQGFPIDEMENEAEEFLTHVLGKLPMRSQLAITCALEHFTALMAEILLSDPSLLEGAHPAVADLWRWHAAEENEHKAVAFDVFEKVGGTYAERANAMVIATAFFWVGVIQHQLRLMHNEGILFNTQEWRSLLHYLFIHGRLQRLIPPYLQYFRPGFHPDDIDTSALLEMWKTQYEAKTQARAA